MRRPVLSVAFAALLLQPDAPPEAMDRMGAYVSGYYARARSIVARETVHLQPLAQDLRPLGRGRELVYELRVEWDPQQPMGRPLATMVRTLLTVDGRPPRPGDEPDCFDPKPVSFEPLSILLPARRAEFVFTNAGQARVDGRRAIVLEYRAAAPKDPVVTWRGECGNIDLRGRIRGRIWADPSNGEVLRIDERLHGGPFQFALPIAHVKPWKAEPLSQTLDRSDSSTRYARVRFTNPDESLMLPASIRSLNVIYNAGVERMLTTQSFSEYKRFVTGGRLVK